MMDIGVSKRYALALFQIAKENGNVDQLEEEVRVVKTLVTDSTELHQVLKSPNISLEQKKEIIREGFASASSHVQNLLMLLIDRHREDYILGICDHFLQLINEEKGIADAIVYSVRPLTDGERAGISVSFAAKVGKASLNIENIVDSNLLGGIIVRIGNQIFDGSLQGKLNRLQRQLLG
ncbi:F0F1 ATP synthase subunit delta [Niallia sp. NCCP-28]|uniref:F0F1 ATP synthase subunit delta n=1 Tax=Niallia sp. NCCP-28 TaxID=2934712 RepID=UPI0020885759|nr:F0F1 ATP synthase subunit delta [Niallia sp. NCCP-28]GKU83667.1 ATP synthase subunit delta [Niallia sp. NCCP-28]